MPEVSSLIRGPEDDDSLPGSFDNLSLEPNSAEAGSLFEGPSVFSIFTLVSQFNIPTFDVSEISKEGIGSSRKAGKIYTSASTLGAGISCNVVILETDEALKDKFVPGTKIALKRYNVHHDGIQSNGLWNKKVYHWLYQELKVLGHPELRKHENIIKLRFIAWGDDSLIPHLGLELATHGTLDDCLQNLRSYGSSTRKCHLSLDISLGLAALASFGLVHGDIKPGNIIICAHDDPERDIIAKIADLNGVSPSSEYGSSGFNTGTPNWQPLEVFFRIKDIDWHLADVYAYGMVMATLWSDKGLILRGGTFLDPHIPLRLSPEDKSSLIAFMKLPEDASSRSMINLALKSLPTESVELPLRDIITHSLSIIPTRRSTILRILHEQFRDFASSTGRLASITSIPHEFNPGANSWEFSHVDGTVWSLSEFHRRSKRFKERMFQVLLLIGTILRRRFKISPIPEISDKMPSDEDELRDLIVKDEQPSIVLQSSEEDKKRLTMLVSTSLNLFLAYIMGVGVNADEKATVDWLRIAAEVGEFHGTAWFCPLEQSVRNSPTLQIPLPRKRWTTTRILNGFVSDEVCLKTYDPSLHRAVVSWRNRHFWGRNNPQIAIVEPYVQMIISQIKAKPALVDIKVPHCDITQDDDNTALHICAATGELDLVKYLRSEFNANINTTNGRNETPIFIATRAGQHEVVEYLLDQGADAHQINTEGLNLLHCLTSMDDAIAARLAPRFVECGAGLRHAAQEFHTPRGDEFFLGAGTPLFWACLKNKPLLFEALSKLHCHPGQQLSPSEYYILLQALARLNMQKTMSCLLSLGSSIVDSSRISSRTAEVQVLDRFVRQGLELLDNKAANMPTSHVLSPMHYTTMLALAIDVPLLVKLHRRYIHMADHCEAKEATIRLLLESGADPMLSYGRQDSRYTLLSLSVQSGDLSALKLIVTTLESREVDVLLQLSDPGLFNEKNALICAIENNTEEIFDFFVDHFPDLLALKARDGTTPLHAAAVMASQHYAEKLLSRGASPYDVAPRATNPFLGALLDNPVDESARSISRLIAKNADLDRLLSPDKEKKGLTAFGQIIAGVSWYKMAFEIDRVEYFIRTYGKPSFYLFENGTTTVFDALLPPSHSLTDHVAIATEGAVLKLLLREFPDKTNTFGASGMTPLQAAIRGASLSSVEILLEHGVDINLECRDLFEGYTPLGLAVFFQKAVTPFEVLREGQRATEIWDENIEGIIDLLVKNGAKEAGKGAAEAVRVFVEERLRGERNYSALLMNIIQRRDINWPKRLPLEGGEANPLQDIHESSTHVEVIGSDGLS
ncbi:serine threonine kinase [Fusarium beomiforme]|uniref:Serine threonine kinase n=1 Tax=Fusarium beomiforme TaxID=44412 RepID=A0A9P5E2E5_9HYPO|nr:serine threonine kinase [Fusarium beomiforme]